MEITKSKNGYHFAHPWGTCFRKQCKYTTKKNRIFTYHMCGAVADKHSLKIILYKRPFCE